MKILMIITLVCGIISLLTLVKARFEVKKSFTKEEWDKLHGETVKEKKWEWYIFAFMFFLPIVNIITMLIVGTYTDQAKREVIEKYKDVLYIEKIKSWKR